MDMEHAEHLSIAEAFDLTGQVAVITGAASGIGRATSYILATAGATLVLGDIDEAGLKTVADDLTAKGTTTVPVHMDVKVREDVDGLVDQAVREFGHIDIMGNIAGIMHRGLIAELDDDEFEFIMSTNMRGTLYGCRAAARAMIPQGSGNIINIASGAIDAAAATIGTYSMSKAAVAILTKVLASELGPHGIRVNALAPGTILSAFSRPHFVDENGEVVPERLEAYKNWSASIAPRGRIGYPPDIAWAIMYLVSPIADFVTGQIVRPNGGTAMPW
jgi:3-oxoacyl-[acyl-carrier protein] reductase